MSNDQIPQITSPLIREYCEAFSSEQSDALKEIEERSKSTNDPVMVSGPFLGKYLSLISKIVSPKYILEVGTFTGYGALCLSEGLQEGGKVITIEKSKEMMDFSTDIYKKYNVDHKIIQQHGDATELIPQLDFMFDLVFIDAAKRKYIEHFELIFPKLEKGAVVLADNVLWKGKVASVNNDKLGEGLHAFNEFIKNDDRVENIIIPIDDGLNLIRKK